MVQLYALRSDMRVAYSVVDLVLVLCCTRHSPLSVPEGRTLSTDRASRDGRYCPMAQNIAGCTVYVHDGDI